MSVTSFAKKQFQKIEILTGGARPAVLAGNDILSGGGYSFKKFMHDAGAVNKAIPAPIKQAIMDGALAAVAGKRPKQSKPKQGHLIKGSKEAKERMAHLRSLRKK